MVYVLTAASAALMMVGALVVAGICVLERDLLGALAGIVLGAPWALQLSVLWAGRAVADQLPVLAFLVSTLVVLALLGGAFQMAAFVAQAPSSHFGSWPQVFVLGIGALLAAVTVLIVLRSSQARALVEAFRT